MMQPDGETQGGASESLNNQNDGNATGSGESSGDMTQDTTGMEAGDLEGDIVEGAGEESEFEAIFDPRRFEGPQGDTDLQLEPDSGENPLQEVESSENPTGQVTVPYNEVFGDYSAAASEALDRGYVPLGLRDVIRSYFTSLAPSGSGGE
jgi:hypothetical protein